MTRATRRSRRSSRPTTWRRPRPPDAGEAEGREPARGPFAARSLGCAPDTAETAGIVVDIAVPVVAVREGLIDLRVEEAASGHTIARHVGKDEAFLRNRLATEPKIPAAGTFRSLQEAEKFVSRAIRANVSQIQSWASKAKPGAVLPLPIYDAGQTVGVTIPRLTGTLKSVSKVQVVLRKSVVGQKVYFVFTAYPSHL